MAETLFAIAGENEILIHGDIVSVGVEPMAIRADVCDRHNLPGIFAAKVFAVCAVTLGAVFLVGRRALRRESLIDRERIDRRR